MILLSRRRRGAHAIAIAIANATAIKWRCLAWST